MKNFFYTLIGIFFIGACIYFVWRKPAPETYSAENEVRQEESGVLELQMGTSTVQAEVVDDYETRALGLSGRYGLEEGKGMLFIFEESGIHGIWMKDMRFAIDIVWMDENKKVIWIEKNVSPETFPEVFFPDSPAKYVLELPSGYTLRHFIDTGLVVSWRE